MVLSAAALHDDTERQDDSDHDEQILDHINAGQERTGTASVHPKAGPAPDQAVHKVGEKQRDAALQITRGGSFP